MEEGGNEQLKQLHKVKLKTIPKTWCFFIHPNMYYNQLPSYQRQVRLL